jgi:hypothetical protein
MSGDGLSARRWRRVRAQVLAVSDLCHLCGHTGAGEGDHVVSRAMGGDKYDPANVAPAHGSGSRCYECDPAGRACNQVKGAGLRKKARGRPRPLSVPLDWL